ncbi:MAG TPA: TauD/TfdA family dioxygenase [Acidimicrobiales bacterium]|jgi:taurine dioxygenase|nr:TauD/TfdA family dioxygenase [Acidimicrobiales bacterium]
MTTTTETAVQLDIAPLSGTIGAEIRNVDLHQELSPEVVAGIRQALLDYKVIFFPGQHLSPEEHKHFGTYFGEITNAHPVIPGIGEHREVFEIDYTQARQVTQSQKSEIGLSDNYGDRDKWHTDVTFVETPPLGSILNAIVIPPAGGDTLWADTNAAYEALSRPIKDLVDGLTAIHDGNHAFGKLLDRIGEGEWEGRKFTTLQPVEHPVVRTHPETGRRSLFVNPGFTIKIKNVSAKESDTVLRFLYDHMATPEFVVRYRWEEGDLGFWDNRTTMHYAITDYGEAHRVIQRVTIKGDKPF